MFSLGGVAEIAFHDLHNVVTHLHDALSMGAAFCAFAGFYPRLEKLAGLAHCELRGKCRFLVTSIGVNMTFFPRLAALDSPLFRGLLWVESCFLFWLFYSSLTVFFCFC